MTDESRPNIQQEWLQIAFNTLSRKTLLPLFPLPTPFDDRVLITWGYGIGGRRLKRPYKCYLKDGQDIKQHTIFIGPHAWTTPTEVLDVLVSAACEIYILYNYKHRPSLIKSWLRSLVYRYERNAILKQKVKQLEMFLPPFPEAPFNPTKAPQPSRLRLWVCERCGTKVRVASDDFKAQCKQSIYTYDPKDTEVCNGLFKQPCSKDRGPNLWKTKTLRSQSK